MVVIKYGGDQGEPTFRELTDNPHAASLRSLRT